MGKQTIPSQDLIKCKTCGRLAEPHKQHRLHCRACVKHKQVEYTRRSRLKTYAARPTRLCTGCGSVIQNKGGATMCKPCKAANAKEWRKGYREKARTASREYRIRHGDEYRKYLVQRRKDAIAKMTPDELAAFRKKEAEKTKRLVAALKDAAFVAYGGWRCACCGETERTFLSIDHIDGNGRKMRKVHGQTGQFYRWLRRCNYPAGFQVLCMNCNFGKHQNGGVCPHQVRCND